MKALKILFLSVLVSLFPGCSNDDEQSNNLVVKSYDFRTDAEGWTYGFADYPGGEEDFYELHFDHTSLPEPLDQAKKSLLLSGNNHSDDLFMFLKKEMKSLLPNRIYNIQFRVEIASNVANGQYGIGGSPGESVYIKAGATPVEPVVQPNEENFLLINIDKGNQSQPGSDMTVLGNFANGTDENKYTLKTLENQIPFTATTGPEGNLWVIFGTDSGFEGTTSIYYNKIELRLEAL